MRPAPLFTLVAVALAGCSPPGGGFSQLGDFQLRFENDSGFVLGAFSYDTAARGCRTLGEDTSATVNGDRVSLFPGDAVTIFAPFPRTECRPPELQFDRPGLLGEAVALVIRSGGEEVDVDVEGLGANLSGTPVLAPGQAIHAGDLIHLTLGGGFERVRWSQVLGAAAAGSNGAMESLTLSPPSPAGMLDVQLPGDLAAGPAHVRAAVMADPFFTRCLGPMACSWDPGLPTNVALDAAFEVAP